MAALPFYHISIIIGGWKPLPPPFRPRKVGLRLNQWVTYMFTILLLFTQKPKENQDYSF